MNHKHRLERFQRELDAQQQRQDDATRRERERLAAMTDEELERHLAALERALADIRREWGVDLLGGKE